MRHLAPIGVLAACTLALGGCALLGGGKPANLYRFGQSTVGDPAPASAQSVGVFRAAGPFQRESAGDRILTVTGGKAAYIAETRWVAPASTLFNQAATAAFDADTGPVRLVSRGEPGQASYVLRLEVRNFETRYDQGPKAAPVVVVRVRATLSPRQAQEVREQMFESQVRADGNRVSGIVAAYDQAVTEVLGAVVTWTNAEAKPTA
ncbi:ABC-type transport auxiliary lipoprotein family protein [Phenylobacterium sp. VNQ135]|uniref:ABC-type transport auxiliary lipoprotein family protein n=1 Tax=Phenylobacterium sp. VNQ135 TaxID=3400922 RepID=UPI003C2ED7D0